jgi:cobalamin biosynthesis Mg chelatase CobN
MFAAIMGAPNAPSTDARNVASCCSTTNLVVIGLGIALAVFFAGATAAVAAGKTPPTALWAAGGAVGGALVGLLAPTPGSKRRHEAAAKAAEDLAKQATSEAATHVSLAKAGDAEAPIHEAQAKAEEARAEKATAEATMNKTAAATTPETTLAAVALVVVFVLLLALGIVLAAGAIVPPEQFTDSLKNVITAVMALASASGTALIGILSPSKGS